MDLSGGDGKSVDLAESVFGLVVSCRRGCEMAEERRHTFLVTLWCGNEAQNMIPQGSGETCALAVAWPPWPCFYLATKLNEIVRRQGESSRVVGGPPKRHCSCI